MKKTKKTIQATMRFHGDGVVRATRDGCISGGAVAPDLGQNIRFLLCQGVPCEDEGESAYREIEKGSFGIHIIGNTRGLRALGEYFLSLAELDASQDQNYHDHLGEVASIGETKIDLVVRKNPKAGFAI